MIRLAVLVAFLGACGGDDSGGKYPIVAGGGGSGNSSMPDAAVGGGDVSNTQTARVCLLTDARNPSACAATGADGLTVTAGGQTATTSLDGTFTITRPTGTNLLWSVTGTGIQPSLMKYSATTTLIPAVEIVFYGDMLSATLPVVVTGDGAILAYLTRNGNAVSGATVLASPQPDSEVYYDGATAVDWELDATEGAGAVWIPSMQPGTVSLSVDSGAVSMTDITGIPVASDTLTVVFSEVL